MELTIKRHKNFFSKYETVHYYESKTQDYIAQLGNYFFYKVGGYEGQFSCSLESKFYIFKTHRILRRLARIDNGSCVYSKNEAKLYCIYQGMFYRYDLKQSSLECLRSFDFRNPLFMSSLVLGETSYVVGEYFPNMTGREVHIYRTDDSGSNWYSAFVFPKNTINHIHGIYFDKYSSNYWICTGDYNGQCKLVVVNKEFNVVESYGNGTQFWRAVSLFFLEDRVVWGMDSPLEESFIMTLDRKSGKLTKGKPLPGPAWYCKHLTDGVGLLQTSVEHSHLPGVKSNSAQLFMTEDFEDWTLIAKWEKDFLPIRYFRPGVILFSDGDQTSGDFLIQGEGLKLFDGACYQASII